MCIIIVKDHDKQISNSILRKSAEINPDGLGILWLDSWKVSYHDSQDWKRLQTKRPYIAHFRYATIGAVDKSNYHPFYMDRQQAYLFQNGTIRGLGNQVKSDTKHLSEILDDLQPRHWRSLLETYNCRFVTADTQKRKFAIYNEEDWHEQDGTLYSKDNVLDEHLLAVYGTLKKGNSNYYHYLSKASYIGKGKSVDKIRMVGDGIPFALPKNGKGHNIAVDVFAVNSKTLKAVDGLEGHPTWYKREKTLITLDNGQQVSAWLYFNDTTDTGKYMKSYEPSYNYNSYNRYLFSDYEPSYNNSTTIQEEEEYCGCNQPSVVWDEYTNENYCNTCLGVI